MERDNRSLQRNEETQREESEFHQEEMKNLREQLKKEGALREKAEGFYIEETQPTTTPEYLRYCHDI